MSEQMFVTGFGAFGHVTDNPSAKLARLCGRSYQVLDVSFEAADAFLDDLGPSKLKWLLLLGVAAGRDHFSLELFARNWIGGAKDIHEQGLEGLIEEGAPLLLESNLWSPELVSQIVMTDPFTKVSMDAGDYLCNYIYYRAMQKLPNVLVGFLHVPTESHIGFDVQQQMLQKILAEIER